MEKRAENHKIRAKKIGKSVKSEMQRIRITWRNDKIIENIKCHVNVNKILNEFLRSYAFEEFSRKR